jgi:hypothetical protein
MKSFYLQKFITYPNSSKNIFSSFSNSFCRSEILLTGVPAYIPQGSVFRITSDFAAKEHPSPTLTPGKTTVFVPRMQWREITTELLVSFLNLSGIVGFVKVAPE